MRDLDLGLLSSASVGSALCVGHRIADQHLKIYVNIFSLLCPQACALYLYLHSFPTNRDRGGERRGGPEGGDICIIMADLHCCMAETNTTLKAILLQLKINLKNILLFER